MENDRKLLEYAAKAAGFQIDQRASFMTWRNSQLLALLNPNGGHTLWNPLTDDGDALRLAVKLKINLQFSGSRYSVSKRTTFDVCCLYESEDQMIDIRRAIVRAAAEIGKAMG